MRTTVCMLFLLLTLKVDGKNYWAWDCEDLNNPQIDYLETNTALCTTEPHSGLKCMQINVSGLGGNQPSGVKPGNIDLGNINNGQWFYYRWWMKLDSNFKWGNGTGFTKASRMKQTNEEVSSRLWTGFIGRQGAFLHESTVLPNYWDADGVIVPYDFQSASGTGWHEYIVAMKMQTGNDGRDGEFHFCIDGGLIGKKTGIHFTEYAGDCSEAWLGWMVSPYIQLNGTESDGGIIWLDDYSMDNIWNSSTYGEPDPARVVEASSKLPEVNGAQLHTRVLPNNKIEVSVKFGRENQRNKSSGTFTLLSLSGKTVSRTHEKSPGNSVLHSILPAASRGMYVVCVVFDGDNVTRQVLNRKVFIY